MWLLTLDIGKAVTSTNRIWIPCEDRVFEQNPKLPDSINLGTGCYNLAQSFETERLSNVNYKFQCP
jgi:hypothetical protein